MDVWTGSISLPSSAPLEDIRLSTPPTALVPSYILSHLTSSLKDATLSLITLLDPTKIPLYLAAGPSLEVTTRSQKTKAYFRRIFVPSLPDNDRGTMEQSRVAVLVHVDRLQKEEEEIFSDVPGNDWKITELVIYGAVRYSFASAATDAPHDITPPNSSPGFESPISITVHALPLSSHHGFPSALPETKPELPLTPLTPVFDRDGAEACFIAPNPQEILNPSISRSAKKRRADALDAVVEKRKKIRASVSQPPPPMTLLGRGNVKREPGIEISGNRRTSTGSNASAIAKFERSPSPVLSRKPSVVPKGRRDSMVNRTGSNGERERESSRPVSSQSSKTLLLSGKREKEEKEVWGDIEMKNRELLAKVVLAGMKSAGVRDYRRERGKSIKFEDGEGEKENGMIEREREMERVKEEFKGIYHMTVKATAFALRNVISKQPVNQDTMKTVVDRLLAVFCGGYGSCAVEAVRAVDAANALEAGPELVDGEE